MIDSERGINEYLWKYGYPFAHSVQAIEDLTYGLPGPMDAMGAVTPAPEDFLQLDSKNPARERMVQLAQEMLWDDFTELGKQYHARAAIADGEPGPATFAALSLPRCGAPDFAAARVMGWDGAEAVASGPWKRCHNVGDFHAVSVQWQNAPPASLAAKFNAQRTVFQEAMRRCVIGYAEIGLLIHFSGPGAETATPRNPVQIKANFVSSSAGWIGLAVIGNNGLGCSANQLWCRYLNSYGRNFSLEDRAFFWAILLMHELGHNCGLGHTRGGIMNPSINRTAARWIGDTAQSWMTGRFGGVKVPDVPDTSPLDWVMF